MSRNNKVIWSEGMLLQPQHLQQHDRYLHALIDTRCAALRPYAFGFRRSPSTPNSSSSVESH